MQQELNDTFRPTRTSSEVAPVLEASADAASLARSAAASKLILAAAAGATTHASPAPLGSGAALVGLLLGRQRRLAFLLVLFQQLGRLLLCHLCVDDLVEALALLGQRVEP